MTNCPSCTRAVPGEALSCASCGAGLIESAAPTRHQPATPPAEQRPKSNPDRQVNRASLPVEGLHFLSMEFIYGGDLSSLLGRIGRLPGDKAVEIARQICAGASGSARDGCGAS